MTNDGPTVTNRYKGGLSLRDSTERLKGHLEAAEEGWGVKLTLQVYASDGSGLVTAFLTVTPEEALEFAAAVQLAAGAARGVRYAESSERFLADLGAVG